MKAKFISLSIALLSGISVWAAYLNPTDTFCVYDNDSKNGYKIGVNFRSIWADLDLPSGLKWGLCNIGAKSPEDYGNFYAWGEKTTKTEFSDATYTVTKYNATDKKTVLDIEDDVAHASLQGSWRMPTNTEWTELIDNCTWAKTQQNGIEGYIVTSKKNSGKSIFIPRAGGIGFMDAYGPADTVFRNISALYWSATLNMYKLGPATIDRFAYAFYSGGVDDDILRWAGLSVRPVCALSSAGYGETISLYANDSNKPSTIENLTSGMKINILAVPKEHRHFVAWHDGNTDNPRSVQVKHSTYFTAIFATDQHFVSVIAPHGTIQGCGTYDYGDTATLVAVADEHYRFVRWGNGSTENPCLLPVTGNTILTAEFELSHPVVPVYDYCSKNGKVVNVSSTQLENGYEWVDLGLPSGVKWATCNVGAEFPEDNGNYYAWGEVMPKNKYWWDTYKYANGANDKLTKYCSFVGSGNYNFTDNKTTLDLEDDVAHVNQGGSWRMPTREEWLELRNNCTWTWVTDIRGISGYRVTSEANGNSIFLPAAGRRDDRNFVYAQGEEGHYWSASRDEDELDSDYAWEMCIYSKNSYVVQRDRCYGLPVRPVCLPSFKTDTISSSENDSLPTLGGDSLPALGSDSLPSLGKDSLPSSGKDSVVIVQDTVVLTLCTTGCDRKSRVICSRGQFVYINAIKGDDCRRFVGWSDGNTDNLRLVKVSQDTTITAEFIPLRYTITTYSQNGTVDGGGVYECDSMITLTATANEHYHFTQWSDGNKNNPRTMVATQDAVFMAEFAADSYTITANSDNSMGIVWGSGTYLYGTQVRLEAYPNSEYKFLQWSNGETYNPYLFTVTEDMTIEAQFGPATAVENVSDDAMTPRKIIRDGQVFILRNGKTYTVTGIEVE